MCGRAFCGGGAAADAAPPRFAPAAFASRPDGAAIASDEKQQSRAAELLPDQAMVFAAAGLLPQPSKAQELWAKTATDRDANEMSIIGMAT